MDKFKLLKVVGIAFLAIGIAIVAFTPDRQQENLQIAKTAKNAQEAARAISANNQSEMFSSSLGYGLAGFGFALTVGGIFAGKFGKKE